MSVHDVGHCLHFKTSAFSCIVFRKSCFYLLEYAQVIKMLGNGRLEAMCFDGVKRLCHIRGKLRKKVHFTDPVCGAPDWMRIQHFHHFVNELGCLHWQKCLGQSSHYCLMKPTDVTNFRHGFYKKKSWKTSAKDKIWN